MCFSVYLGGGGWCNLNEMYSAISPLSLSLSVGCCSVFVIIFHCFCQHASQHLQLVFRSCRRFTATDHSRFGLHCEQIRIWQMDDHVLTRNRQVSAGKWWMEIFSGCLSNRSTPVQLPARGLFLPPRQRTKQRLLFKISHPFYQTHTHPGV